MERERERIEYGKTRPWMLQARLKSPLGIISTGFIFQQLQLLQLQRWNQNAGIQQGKSEKERGITGEKGGFLDEGGKEGKTTKWS